MRVPFGFAQGGLLTTSRDETRAISVEMIILRVGIRRGAEVLQKSEVSGKARPFQDDYFFCIL